MSLLIYCLLVAYFNSIGYIPDGPEYVIFYVLGVIVYFLTR